MRSFRLLLGFVLIVTCASVRLLAQGAVEPVYVPLKIKIKGTVEGSHTPSKASITATVDTVPAPPPAVGKFTSATAIDFPVQILPVELGRDTALTISGELALATKFTLTPPPGYTLLIDGLERKSKSVNGSGVFKIRVLPALDAAPAPAGTATEFSPGQVKWGVSLGGQRNGGSLGWLWIIGAGVSDWGSFKSTNNLYFEKDSDELVSQKQALTNSGSTTYYRQIRTNEAVVDIITPTTQAAANVAPAASDSVYELRFYHPSDMSTSGTIRLPLANKQPFVVYRLIDESAGTTQAFRMEKQVCSLADSATRQVIRTENTTITRAGTSNTTYTWTATGWTEAGQDPQARAVATWSGVPGIANAHHEVLEVWDLTTSPNQVVSKTVSDHVPPVPDMLPRMLSSVTAAPDATDSVGSTTTYYADLNTDGTPQNTKRYRFGFPQFTTSTGGSWSAMTYVDPDTRSPAIPAADKDNWLGVTEATFSPWLDTAAPTLAANATPTLLTGMIATYFDYDKDPFDYPSRVTLTETYRDSKLDANRISKTTTTYANSSQNGRSTVVATSKNYFGSGANDYLTSTRISFREDDPLSFWRNQVNTEISPAGAKVGYVRQRGNLPATAGDPNLALVFDLDSGAAATRIGVITGAQSASGITEPAAITSLGGQSIQSMYLLPGRSMLSWTYRDMYARVVRTESYLRSTSATWELVAWENLTYNERNQLTQRTASNGDLHEFTYTGEYLTGEVDPSGVATTYEYDVSGRLKKSTRVGYLGAQNLITEMTYDGADRVIEQRTYAADTPGLKSITTRIYDLAGRVVSEKSSGSPAVTTAYNPTARTTTVTNSATFATKTNETYLDGQPKSVTGTGVVEERYAYAIESDGRRRTEVTSGPVGSLRTVKSWSDWLGRSARSERPAPPSVTGPLVSETFYDNTTGLPVRGTSPASATTLSTYDGVGEELLTGLDVDGSGALEPASARDRITGTRKSAVFSESAWWATSESYIYATAGSATETILSKSWTRLTGLTGGLVGETRSWDAEGNLTRRTVERDRNDRKVTTRTWLPGIAAPQTDITVDGLATESTAPDGLRATTTYDGLRRPYISSTSRPDGATPTDMRSVMTQYQSDGLGTEATTLVWKVIELDTPNATVPDPNDRTTIYTKFVGSLTEPASTTITNPDSKYVTQLYNLRGQVTHVYGTATSPVQYEYDDGYGHRTKQYTYRDSADHYASKDDFLAANDAIIDCVSWEYDLPTGLLKKKTDPLNRFVQYTYDAAGRIATRQWARFLADGITPLTSTPTYDAATGDLLSTAYNDGGVTPTVSTTYDRLGRPQTITDATGTRTFVRDTAKPWRTTTEQLPAFYGAGRQLSWLYEESSGTSGGNGYVLGRSRGFRLGTAAQPDALLEQTFARSDIGRLSGITSTHSAASTRNFAYTYTPNSRLVKSLTAPGTGFSLTRQWDPLRGLLTQIETKSGTRTLANYDYTYHPKLNQRQTATQTGDAFAADVSDPAATTTVYKYNDRGEVESALAGLTPPVAPDEPPGNLIPGRQFAFRYDLAGNRVKSSHQNDISDVIGQANGAATAKYVVGKGNQLTKRDNPVASVSGVIANTATVMAVDQSPLTPADRQGHHWQRDVESPETGEPRHVDPDGGNSPLEVDEYPRKARSLVTLASLLGAGTGGADLTAFDRRMLVMNPRDEQFRYDRDGNLLRDGTWDYVWDAENRLVRMFTHDWLADQDRKLLEFTYDYQGRRVSKRVQIWPVGASGYLPATETRFLYDGWNLIAELEATSSQLPAPSLKRSFTWGLDLIGSLTASGGVGALVQITDHADGQSYLPGYDGNGNVAVLVRASDGYRAAAYEYGPYGEVLRSEGTYAAQNAFRFSTKFTDVESGLVYYGMRYYDARNGRFINRDPIEERGGLNLYGFCGNDGVNRYDVLGMSWLSKAFKKLKKWIGKHQWVAAVVAAVVSIVTWGALSGPATAWAAGVMGVAQTSTAAMVAGGAIAGAAGGFVGGMVGTGLMGGSLSQMLTAGAWGALSGAVAGGIGGRFGPVGKGADFSWTNEAARATAHGISQGGINSLRGGKFGAGAAAGVFSSFAGSGLQGMGAPWQVGVPASGIIGGASSRIGGGSFQDGFASGFAVGAYNHWGSDISKAIRTGWDKTKLYSGAVWEGIKSVPSYWERAIVDPMAPGSEYIAFIEGAGEGIRSSVSLSAEGSLNVLPIPGGNNAIPKYGVGLGASANVSFDQGVTGGPYVGGGNFGGAAAAGITFKTPGLSGPQIYNFGVAGGVGPGGILNMSFDRDFRLTNLAITIGVGYGREVQGNIPVPGFGN